MRRFSYFLLLTIVLYPSAASFGQEEQYFVTPTKYTQNDGLSSYFITKIVKDSYGFLWVGTQEGLNLFDGNRFQVFTKQSPEKHRLGGSFVADLAEDKKRKWLWVLMSYGDICAIDLQTRVVCKRITPDRSQPQEVRWNRCLEVQGDTLWTGGLDFISAYHIEEDRYLPVDIKHKSHIGSGECNIARICFDSQGRMMIFSDGFGIVVFDKDLNRLQTFREELSRGKVQNRKLRFWDAAFKNNTLYVASNWGLHTFKANAAGPFDYLPEPANPVAARSEIQSLAFASDSTLLFSTPQGFYRYNLLTSKIVSYRDENPEDNWFASTFQLFYDTLAQRAWIGTQAGLGSFLIVNNSFRAFSKSSAGPVKLKHLYTVLPASGRIIYCGDEDGIYHVDAGTKEITRIDTASANLMLFKDAGQNIFVSNKNGFHIISGKTVKPAHTVFPSLRPLNADHLSCGIQYNDSLVLFSSIIQKGLTLWNTASGALTVFHKDSAQHRIEGLSIINYLFKNSAGQVMILTEKSVIAFNPITGAYTTHTIRDSQSQVISNFMDMCETEDRYWIATYGNGLIETDKDLNVIRILTVDDGLSNNCVYRVFARQNGSIIATTNRGLAAIGPDPLRIKNYFRSDGLHANEFEQLCGHYHGDRILAGGANGFTIIDPAALPHNAREPGLYMESLRITTRSGVIDTFHIAMKKMTIPTDVLQTTVAFSALNYSNPAAVNYAYKIKELNSDWINQDHQNFVNLIGLAPGAYTLQVRASNEDGIWNAQPLELQLVYLPKWYQTGIFKIVVMLTGAFLIYGLLRYRIEQLKKQQQIRQEIGNDLHDDIGSALNTLKIFTHLARREPENTEHLAQIEESITQATIGLRDMIWVLEDAEDSIFELVERIKKFALPVCVANQIQFNAAVRSDKNTRALLKTEKRNLLLIAKETINNSIKYAHCRHIEVVLVQTGGELSLRITDDGAGFDINNIVYGKGLKNIQYRARQIFFKAEIISSPQQGTSVVLSRPAGSRWMPGWPFARS